MIHVAFFYVPVNFAFNLPHYLIRYMHHTRKKDSKKEKEKKNKVTKNLLQGNSNPDAPNTLEVTMIASIHWTAWVSADF